MSQEHAQQGDQEAAMKVVMLLYGFNDNQPVAQLGCVRNKEEKTNKQSGSKIG
jgi:hypothetical protein